MIRVGLTEIALFAAPFVLYAVFLWLTKAGVMDTRSWPLSRLAWLAMAALALVVGSFLFFAHFSGSKPGSEYVPAHLENGKFVPGATK
ncbi:MAG: DUF6111 family protein [Hyphomicrobiales bacterium]|nr:DUF6111 family protein [Hyphomicrobiales bacterium]